MPTKKLIELLGKVATDDSIPQADYINCDNDTHNELLDEIELEACGCLINHNGSCNFANHKIVTDAGFKVFCGEKDSFGWLTGCIRTPKGVIVYG